MMERPTPPTVPPGRHPNSNPYSFSKDKYDLPDQSQNALRFRQCDVRPNPLGVQTNGDPLKYASDEILAVFASELPL
jgi:hypothetical protein